MMGEELKTGRFRVIILLPNHVVLYILLLLDHFVFVNYAFIDPIIGEHKLGRLYLTVNMCRKGFT